MRKITKVMLLIVFLIGILISNICYADSEACDVKITSDKTKLNAGDVVTLSVKLSNVNIEDGISAIVGELDYDQEIFDIVYETDSDIEDAIDLETQKEEYELDNLKVVYYNEDGWYLCLAEIEDADGATIEGLTLGDPVTSSETIGTIKLKVKSTAKATTTEIGFGELYVLDDAEEPYEITTEPSVSLTIASTTNEPTTNKNTNINTNTEKVYNGTTANTAAPYAGSKEVTPIILIVTIIAIITLGKVIKYKDIK